MGFVQDFRDFAIKGNVFDLAIGVIMGGAFGKIVSSLIDNVLNPILGKLTGGVDFSNRYIVIGDSAVPDKTKYADAKAITAVLGHGQFISDIINFLIMAFVVFLMVKAYTTAKKRFEKEKPAPAPAPAGPSEKDYLKEIRDLLARK